MGTTYSIKVVAPPDGVTEAVLRAEVETSLARVDRIFSTYRQDSEVSRFNASSTQDWQPVSHELVDLVGVALSLSRHSGSAFDITMPPLARLWGLGTQWDVVERIPNAEMIAHARSHIGHGQLEYRAQPPALRKRAKHMEIDLNAVVAGYAADQVAMQLEQRGIRRYLVDMGGEMRMLGTNARDEPWSIAIERPREGHAGVMRVIPLTDCAVATSGSYQNFIEIEGQRFPHVLDARSGRPINHPLVSVTVLARTALQADAWATVLLILGDQEGYALAERRGLSVFMVTEREGELHQQQSPGFGACPDSPVA